MSVSVKKTRNLLLPLRLSAFPAVAAAAVIVLSVLSLLELHELKDREQAEGSKDTKDLGKLKPPENAELVPLTQGVPKLSEAEAIAIVRNNPTKAAVMRLWPLQAHREELFQRLVSKDTPQDIRLYLLGAFQAESKEKALGAARSIVEEKELLECPLLALALETIAREGDSQDLALFSERPGESHQLKALREEYRELLKSRLP